MKPEVEWGQPGEASHGGGGGPKYVDFANHLRQRPGEWAKLPGGPHHRTMTTYINSGKSASFQGPFEATSRTGGVIWIRYTGDDDVA